MFKQQSQRDSSAPPPRRHPSFRFSLTDAIVIMICALATPLLYPLVGRFALLIPITLFHFFLFCNVFRVRRYYEILWAILFVLNVALWTTLLPPPFPWPQILLAQTPVTFAVILLEIRSPHYHGILHTYFNPKQGHPPSRHP